MPAQKRLRTDHGEPELESNDAALVELDEGLSCGSDEDVDPVVDPQAYAEAAAKQTSSLPATGSWLRQRGAEPIFRDPVIITFDPK